MQGVALLAAICSAAGVAVSTSLQHEQAGVAQPGAGGSAHLMAHLLRKPRWIVAQLVSVASFGMHTVALRYGSLALVQPVVVSGMVLAVPIRSALTKRAPRLDEIGPVLITGSGLTLFLVASGPVSARSPDAHSHGVAALAFTFAGLGAALSACYAGSRCTAGGRRASLLGVAAGILFGVAAGLLKLVIGDFEGRGVLVVLTDWPAWALLAAGIGGSAINQSAYRAGKLTASMPLLNVTDVLVSLGFGLAALGEVPAHSLTAVVAQCCALCCVAVGLWALARADHSARVRRRVTPTMKST